jgi:hypothetical protein
MSGIERKILLGVFWENLAKKTQINKILENQGFQQGGTASRYQSDFEQPETLLIEPVPLMTKEYVDIHSPH